ncbi:Phenylacetyl-CoA ligase epaB [Cladobotryum mycophilum]|uniref:Phenylacetyl-CoA ligase epaB n=1 Tax=Cladobotryum mycophilum TaxID=491253 RepID=A0ABR0SI09_9HYPO
MPFLSQSNVEIPTTDLTTWFFHDNPEISDVNNPIFIDTEEPSRYYTHSTAQNTIRKLVAGLRAHGLRKGECVCVHSFNDIDYPILVNGIIAAGGIWAGTNPSYTANEIAHAIKIARIAFFVVEPELLQNVVAAADQVGLARNRIFTFDHVPGHKATAGFESWRNLMEHGEQDWEAFDDGQKSKNTTVARCFSSGTTGLPKAAVLSHYNFIAQHCIVNVTKKDYEEKRIVPLPLYHMASIPSSHFSALRDGVKTFIMRRFELRGYLRNIQKYQITELLLVPPMVMAIINNTHLLNDPNYSLDSIRNGIGGAAPLRKEPQQKLKALLRKKTPWAQIWAMTETTCFATMFPYPLDDDTGSVGYPLSGIDLKLVDEEGNDISKPDTPGELCIRGPTVIRGYLDASVPFDSDNPGREKLLRSDWDADGFFHTGDIAHVKGPDAGEDAGKWYIVDRKKELIKVRGFQVAPPELEGVLISHPLIQDAAVIGIEMRENGVETGTELPRAYIVRTSDNLAAEDVKTYLASKLAKYKRLDGGVVFVDQVPRNPSGKILKRILRERAAKEIKEEENRINAKL